MMDSQAPSLKTLYDGVIISKDELQVLKNLGEGPTGSTQLAWYTPKGKTGFLVLLKAQSCAALAEADYKDYLSQLNVLRKLRHKFIIEHIGVHAAGTTFAELQSSTINIVEHASAGPMREYLHRALYKMAENKGMRIFNYCDALRWMTQVAKGLQFLHGHRPAPLLHGALTLDSVHLKAAGGNQPINLVAKIGDYSLMMLQHRTALIPASASDDTRMDEKLQKQWNSRFSKHELKLGSDKHDMSISRHSAKTFFNSEEFTALQLLNTAPEVYRSNTYTTKADVFALGMVMHEVFHCYPLAWAAAPTGSTSDMHRFAEQLALGYRPPIDLHLPNSISLLIQECWQADPALRPSIDVVVAKLGAIDRSCVMLELDAAVARRASAPACCAVS